VEWGFNLSLVNGFPEEGFRPLCESALLQSYTSNKEQWRAS